MYLSVDQFYFSSQSAKAYLNLLWGKNVRIQLPLINTDENGALASP